MKYLTIILGLWILGFLHLESVAQQKPINLNQQIQAESWIANIQNQNSGEISASLFISIESLGARIKAWPERNLSLSPGTNRLDLSEYLEAAKQLASPKNLNTPLSGCLELRISRELILRNCQELPILPVLPPHLVYPFDGDELISPLPSFSWTAPGPIIPPQPIYYQLKVVEMTGYYTAKVAIQSLPAFYEQEGLREQVHPFNPRGKSFEIGKTYAWQIRAVSAAGQDLGFSEVWTFSLGGPKEEKKDNRPYVELKQNYDASYYLAYGKVKFRFDCRYGEEGPIYRIKNQRGEPLKVSTSKLEKEGDNLFSLELPPGSGFVEGEYYFLEVDNGKGDTRKLKFRYFYALP
ncbi:MAG: hypothetical protein AAF696_08320 [Bacteroidota bacterium]